MTAAVVAEPSLDSPPLARERPFVGTAALVRFALRRDRLRLPVWLGGITLLAAYFLSVLSEVMETEEQRQDIARFAAGGLGAIFGPGYGREDLNPERYMVGVYGLFFFVLAALMSMLAVSRHTRADEQAGRIELIRSSVVGRQAPLTAAMLLAVGANVVLALLLGGVLAATGADAADGLLFGAGVGAVGVVFAGVAAVTAQLTQNSRAATGLAGAALGGAWAIRAAGDMMADHGSALSWFSPLAWSNQTRPYVEGRWWPLLLSLSLAAVAISVAYALGSRRDLGAGLVAARGGRRSAPAWLDSPLAAAWRLQRASLLWWVAALGIFGLAFGALADQVADPEAMSDDRVEMFGGSVETLVEGYLGVITLVTASLVAVMVVLAVRSLRSDETSGRSEALLATSVSRVGWLASNLAVTAVGLAAVLLVVGLATGMGAALSTGEGPLVPEVAIAHLAHLPGVLVLLGLATVCLGFVPRAIGLVWVVLVHGLFVGLFGSLVDHPSALRNLVPAEHIGQPLLDGFSLPSIVVLTALAVVLTAAGVAGFVRRDLEAP